MLTKRHVGYGNEIADDAKIVCSRDARCNTKELPVIHKAYYAKNGRLIPTAKRGKELKQR